MKTIYAKCDKCGAIFAASCNLEGAGEIMLDYGDKKGITVSITSDTVAIRHCSCTLPTDQQQEEQ